MYCAARRGMPGQIVITAGFTENNAGRRKPGGEFATVAFLDPFDLNIAPVGFAGVIDINVMNAHLLRFSLIRSV